MLTLKEKGIKVRCLQDMVRCLLDENLLGEKVGVT